jgi:hypothetical protein
MEWWRKPRDGAEDGSAHSDMMKCAGGSWWQSTMRERIHTQFMVSGGVLFRDS